MSELLDPADDTAFRRVLGHFASGLTIVTAAHDDHRYGLTCQSFTSVSLDPPLVAFFARRESRSWEGVRQAGKFCVNMLADHQELLARVFASPGVDKFHDLETDVSSNGSPILPGVIAWIDCEIDSVFDAGDHQGVLGRVQTLAHVDNAMPLLYFRGGYGTFGA